MSKKCETCHLMNLIKCNRCKKYSVKSDFIKRSPDVFNLEKKITKCCIPCRNKQTKKKLTLLKEIKLLYKLNKINRKNICATKIIYKNRKTIRCDDDDIHILKTFKNYGKHFNDSFYNCCFLCQKNMTNHHILINNDNTLCTRKSRNEDIEYITTLCNCCCNLIGLNNSKYKNKCMNCYVNKRNNKSIYCRSCLIKRINDNKKQCKICYKIKCL